MAAVQQRGRYFIDGADLWTYYGVGVESGSDDFLKMPKPKERTTHDWTDENGIDVDLSRTFVEPKEAELKCHLIANDENDFWIKYQRLLATLLQPGLRRLSITELNRDFYVFYKEMAQYQRFTRLQHTNLVACKFGIKFIEKSPDLTGQTFLINETNQFLIV